MSKFEWKKKERYFYIPKASPTLITIPKQKFFTIIGTGNPNTSPDFQEKIEILYNLAYKVKMMPKSGYTPKGYFDYTVYPLEGIWDLSEGQDNIRFNKENLEYKIMIRQPDFVNNDVFSKALEMCRMKKENPLFDEVLLEEIEDGLCVQMLHIGSFDNEYKSFQLINEFLETNNYKRRSFNHREIYLNNFKKVEVDKLKTTLRVFITNK